MALNYMRIGHGLFSIFLPVFEGCDCFSYTTLRTDLRQIIITTYCRRFSVCPSTLWADPAHDSESVFTRA